MKIIDGKLLRAPALLMTVFLLLSFFSLPAFTEVGQDPQQRFFIGVAAGSFYPQQSTFRKIYNKPRWPVELQLNWMLSRKISVFGAASYLRTSGNTIIPVVRQPEEAYALRLQILTLRLGLNYWFGQRRLTPFFGTGFLYTYFKEKWLDVPKEEQGRKTGFFAQGGGRYTLSRSLHILMQLEYSFHPAGSGAQDKVNLGGLSLMLGLAIGVF